MENNMLLVVVLVVVIIQFILNLVIAGALSKLIRYIEKRGNEPVMGSRSHQGLQNLQDERSDRWGTHVSYDMPNYDGVTPRPKNFDGVGEAL